MINLPFLSSRKLVLSGRTLASAFSISSLLSPSSRILRMSSLVGASSILLNMPLIASSTSANCTSLGVAGIDFAVSPSASSSDLVFLFFFLVDSTVRSPDIIALRFSLALRRYLARSGLPFLEKVSARNSRNALTYFLS